MQGSIYTWPVGKGGLPARHVLGTCWACRPKLLPMKLAPWGSQTWGQFPLSGRGGGYQVRLPGGGVPYLMGQAKLATTRGRDGSWEPGPRPLPPRLMGTQPHLQAQV